MHKKPKVIGDWLERDEPTSDLYHMSGRRTPKRLSMPQEYRGSADLRWQGPEAQNYEAERRRRRSVRDELAIMLDGFQWDWFATYTLNMMAKPDTVYAMFLRHLKFLESRSELPVYAFRGDEYGVLNGRFHIHALIGNVGDFPSYCGEKLARRNAGDRPRPCCGVHSWPGGYARIERYDPSVRATGYVSKYVTKDLASFDFIGTFVRLSPIQPNLLKQE